LSGMLTLEFGTKHSVTREEALGFSGSGTRVDAFPLGFRHSLKCGLKHCHLATVVQRWRNMIEDYHGKVLRQSDRGSPMCRTSDPLSAQRHWREWIAPARRMLRIRHRQPPSVQSLNLPLPHGRKSREPSSCGCPTSLSVAAPLQHITPLQGLGNRFVEGEYQTGRPKRPERLRCLDVCGNRDILPTDIHTP